MKDWGRAIVFAVVLLPMSLGNAAVNYVEAG